MNYRIRELVASDEPFLFEMLYQALYVPPGQPPFEREVVEQPELAKYVKDWGQTGDVGLISVADADGEPLGAIWVRLLTGEQKGYGYVDDKTPELGLALRPEARGQGLGSQLLEQMLERLPQQGYGAVSLSVEPENPAYRLYRRFGFEETGITVGSSVTMVKEFLKP